MAHLGVDLGPVHDQADLGRCLLAAGTAGAEDLDDAHDVSGFASGAADGASYSLSQTAMSPAEGMRPALTTLPSMTRPGVDSTPWATISA